VGRVFESEDINEFPLGERYRIMAKMIRPSQLLGALAAALLAGSAAYAAQDPFDGLILYEDLNDYTDVPPGLADGVSAEQGTGYTFNILLDEAYVDYQTEDVVALQHEQQVREEAEIAAFELGGAPSSDVEVPWELDGAKAIYE